MNEIFFSFDFSVENVELKECSALHKAVIHSSCLRHMDSSNLPCLEILDFQCPLKSLDLSYCTRYVLM